MSSLVTFDELPTEIAEVEYTAFLKNLKEEGYLNDAMVHEGHPVDVNDYIMSGAEILIDAVQEENN